MGVNISKRTLFAALFAALFIMVSLFVVSWLTDWLSSETTDELFGLLHKALWLVIFGVIAEEWELFPYACKFINLAWNGKFREALRKTCRRKGKLVEAIGFFILAIGLASELALQPLIETRQKIELGNATETAKTANAQTRALGDFTAALEEAVTPRADEFEQSSPGPALQPFSDVAAFFEVAPKDEPKDFASSLAFTLRTAGWKNINSLSPDAFSANAMGVKIQYAKLFQLDGVPLPPSSTRAHQAARALCSELIKQGIFARTSGVIISTDDTSPFKWNPAVPLDAIVIDVGPKPTGFFINQLLKKRHSRELPDDVFSPLPPRMTLEEVCS